MARMTTQETVADLVSERGYREGWTPAQFIARQVAKLAEELAELACHVRMPVALTRSIALLGLVARKCFDDESIWPKSTSCAVWPTQEELADIQVVVFCIAEALGEASNKPFDVSEAALEKARADAIRGVR